MNTTAVVIIVVGAVLLIGGVAAVMAQRRARRHRLQERFGPEYDRAVETAGDARKAESSLRERAELRDRLSIRPLSTTQREAYEQEWRDVQAEFVDAPSRSLDQADDLLTKVMVEMGYPMQDFDAQADLISVDHPDVVELYRRAHGVQVTSATGAASTEAIREAFVSYRRLFAELLTDGEADGTRPVARSADSRYR